MTKENGFTMVELMIVVVIIAVLAAIALPSYRQYVLRANRTEATRYLSDIAARQERYYYSNNHYTSTLADLSAGSIVPRNYAFSTVASAASVSPPTYAITATPIGNQLRDDKKCLSISLNNVGIWHSTGTAADDPKCWGN